MHMHVCQLPIENTGSEEKPYVLLRTIKVLFKPFTIPYAQHRMASNSTVNNKQGSGSHNSPKGKEQ